MDEQTFYIIYPRGDKTKLDIVGLIVHMEYELSDYAVASRRHFADRDDAVVYAKQLAKDNNLTFSGETEDSNSYLD